MSPYRRQSGQRGHPAREGHLHFVDVNDPIVPEQLNVHEPSHGFGWAHHGGNVPVAAAFEFRRLREGLANRPAAQGSARACGAAHAHCVAAQVEFGSKT